MTAAATAGAKDRFEWRWRACLGPFAELWRRDKLFVFIFLAVNLFLGQIGVVTSLAFAGSPAAPIAKVWASNIEAAALYTFSITLLTSALAALATEVIDKIRLGDVVSNFEYKAFWCVIALPLVIFQSTLAGNLIAKASVTTSVATGYAAPATTTPLAAAPAPQGASSSPTPSVTTDPRPMGASSPTPNPVMASTTWIGSVVEHAPGLQVVLWLLSMIAAFELFCLQRNPLTPDNYATERNSEMAAMATKADKAHATSFGEQI